ncbi:D-Ala-D-Ala carboxypeptidase family metallohydrolase [Notoacmeibacter sp. MSK16QG-6]|uniref:D-Ala-D-Ala carboxypeptidase family metallohydrolase n=1 Tax=Notoacmeibacter sp. MSK16QG-6 TaxID=2957982 RepID=UPI0020A0DED2|nr:D-Ala-D-Ala carboxypeptidase family metallohydrolase [Notoacmeibacter sp. MSK16QG-6]MCP1199372.1 D-Ala-D-Ala carboxypeptidase family metallohydrolase [Notoacmeibacter sp. MSK16QG-6]
MRELKNRSHGTRLAALLLLSASALSVAGCTSGTPVPPLGLALADVAATESSTTPPQQVASDDSSAPSGSASELAVFEQGDGDGGSEDDGDSRLAMNDGAGATPAQLAPPSSGAVSTPPPIQLASQPAAASSTDAPALATAAMAPVAAPSTQMPRPIPLQQNSVPRAQGQGQVALALAEPPRPIRLDRPVSNSLSPTPAMQASVKSESTAQIVGAGESVLPGVDKNRLFEIERKDGLSDNSDIDLEESDEPVRLASLSGLARLAPNGLKTQHDGVDVKCLKPALVRVLNQVERKFGRPVIVTSGFRSRKRNASARGAKRSLHMFCAAADIQVEGVSKWTLAEYLRGMDGRGGVGTYCHTKSVHIDVGPQRDWNWRCKRRRRR